MKELYEGRRNDSIFEQTAGMLPSEFLTITDYNYGEQHLLMITPISPLFDTDHKVVLIPPNGLFTTLGIA